MTGYINGIDWVNAAAMKYWSFPASYSKDKRLETKNMIFSGEYLAALKVDGYYERIIKDEDGNCFMIARSQNVNGEAVNKIDWVPQLKEFLKDVPNGTVFLSECYLPNNEGSKKITQYLGCLKEKCIARQEKEQKLHFYIFDIMAENGVNYTTTHAADRFARVEALSKIYSNEYVQWAKYYEGAELWNKLQEYLSEDREGIVLMRKDASVYFKRTPARVSLKVKKEIKETIDCFFTGRVAAPTREYTGKEIESWKYWVDIENNRLPEKEHYYEASVEGKPYMAVTKPYYYHWAGSLEIAVMDEDKVYPIGYISGLTDEIKMNYKDYKNRVIEVGAMEIMPDTLALRHGKMLGFRDDKLYTECTLDQLKSL